MGDLYDAILKKMHLRDVGRYSVRWNNALWTDVRCALHSVTEVPLAAVELKTPLANLFPRKTMTKLAAMWEFRSTIAALPFGNN
ncbi:MAG: hypothetical protein ACC628_20830 [Pirellulaceae bacterium]